MYPLFDAFKEEGLAPGLRRACREGRIKSYFKENMTNPEFKSFWELSFGKVPREQLFSKKDDPDMINNLAEDPEYEMVKEELRDKLEKYLIETDDPRSRGESPWDDYNLDK